MVVILQDNRKFHFFARYQRCREQLSNRMQKTLRPRLYSRSVYVARGRRLYKTCQGELACLPVSSSCRCARGFLQLRVLQTKFTKCSSTKSYITQFAAFLRSVCVSPPLFSTSTIVKSRTIRNLPVFLDCVQVFETSSNDVHDRPVQSVRQLDQQAAASCPVQPGGQSEVSLLRPR